MAEPKQKIAGRHGTDSRTWGVVSKTMEEVRKLCRLAQSNGKNMEHVHLMAKILRLLAMEDRRGSLAQI